ncbi:MAG: DUF1932 domain-containing protein [Pseudomonadota bacterium]
MNDDDSGLTRLAFIGFGEAATAFLGGWDALRPAHIAAYDLKGAAIADRYRRYGVAGCARPGQALDTVQAVWCLVTADQALTAAEAAAPVLSAGTLWLDGNSCAPQTKRAAAAAIETAGGRYVDVAIMAPVHPARHRAPLLLSGPHSAAAGRMLKSLGMQPSTVGARVGEASAIKMIRSVMIKGMEALSAECFLAARRAGVEDRVLASLDASNPEIAWAQQGAYNLGRMMAHGARRAAEMHEAAQTVAGLGLGGGMSSATAAWQARIAALGVAPGADDLVTLADRLLAGLSAPPPPDRTLCAAETTKSDRG